MKQKLYLYGIVTAIVIFTGLTFKLNHWPAAGILLTLGLLNLALVFIPLALADMYRGEDSIRDKAFYFSLLVTTILVFISMLFKIMHWPYAGLLLLVALPFPYLVFLPVFLRVVSRTPGFNINNVVAVLALLAFFSVFSALLALNVSKEKLVESLNISARYNASVKALETYSREGQGPAAAKIDIALGIADEYRGVILRHAGLSPAPGNPDEALVRLADSRSVAASALAEYEPEAPGMKLAKALKDAGAALEENSDTRVFAEMLYTVADVRDPEWAKQTFSDSFLVWVLADIDAVSNCLNLIKTATQ